MKKIAVIIFILFCILLLNAESQITFEINSTENDQLISRLSSYFYLQNGNWTFLNTTKLKYSDIQDNIDNYYQESYIRNLFQSYYDKDNYSVNLRFGIGLSPSDNHMVLPEGMNNLIEHQNMYSLGGGYLWDNHKTYLDIDFEYMSSEFDRYELDQSFSEKFTESDLNAQVKAGLWISQDALLYVANDHFNDLNEADQFNYSDYYLNLQFEKRLNFANHFKQDIALGYSDINKDLPYYLRTKTRISTRFAPDWTILNFIQYELWLDEENEIYLGNSLLRSVVRRNLGITDLNELSYLQAAAQYELDTEIGFTQLAAAYNIKKVQLKVSEKYYFGDSRWLNNELEVGSYWIFPMNNLKIGYFAGYIIDATDDSDLQHNLVINMEF